MPTRSVLLLDTHVARRRAVANALHADGVVVVEAVSAGQAETILGQLVFDAVAIEFAGASVGIIELLNGLSTDHSETHVLVLHPPDGSMELANLRFARFGDCADVTGSGWRSGPIGSSLNLRSDIGHPQHATGESTNTTPSGVTRNTSRQVYREGRIDAVHLIKWLDRTKGARSER